MEIIGFALQEVKMGELGNLVMFVATGTFIVVVIGLFTYYDAKRRGMFDSEKDDQGPVDR